MPPRIRLLYSGLAVVFLVMAVVPLYRELSRPSDIWWTPRTMLVPLAGSQDRVEIYARGKLLRTLLEAGQLGITDDTGSSALASLLLGYAAVCGAMGVILVLVATGRLTYRGENERVAGSDATAR